MIPISSCLGKIWGSYSLQGESKNQAGIIASWNSLPRACNIAWEHKIFKISSENVVIWVYKSQKQSNSNFYYIILLGSLPSFYWYHFYLIWLRSDGDTACMGNPQTRRGIHTQGGEQTHATGNKHLGQGFQTFPWGTTICADYEDNAPQSPTCALRPLCPAKRNPCFSRDRKSVV